MPRVLVVDDDHDILQIVGMLLTMNGFIVKKLYKADQAIEEVKSFNPDIILLDVTIAGYDGREICKQLKATNSAFKHIPVILFSAMHNLQFSFPECDATDFLAKPFEAVQLIEKIKHHTKTFAA